MGARRVLLWPPENATHLYMDEGEHRRYGLSSINVDRVDLRRFSRLADAVPYDVRLDAGDALYVPAFWWHQVQTPVGRNILLTTELEYKQYLSQVVHRSDQRQRSNSSVLLEAVRLQRTVTRPAALQCDASAQLHAHRPEAPT